MDAASSTSVILPTNRFRVYFAAILLSLCAANLISCGDSQKSLKKIFSPPDVVLDTTGPHYLHNVSEIKYWDRIGQANRATNFSWFDSTGKVHEMNEYFD